MIVIRLWAGRFFRRGQKRPAPTTPPAQTSPPKKEKIGRKGRENDAKHLLDLPNAHAPRFCKQRQNR